MPQRGADRLEDLGGEVYLISHNLDLPANQDGQWDESGPDHVIRIDPRIRGPQYTETLIHEWLHSICPNHQESWVEGQAKNLTHLIWHTDSLNRALLRFSPPQTPEAPESNGDY